MPPSSVFALTRAISHMIFDRAQDPFRSTSTTSLPHQLQGKDEDADMDNRFFNVPPPHSLPENFEFTHAV